MNIIPSNKKYKIFFLCYFIIDLIKDKFSKSYNFDIKLNYISEDNIIDISISNKELYDSDDYKEFIINNFKDNSYYNFSYYNDEEW